MGTSFPPLPNIDALLIGRIVDVHGKNVVLDGALRMIVEMADEAVRIVAHPDGDFGGGDGAAWEDDDGLPRGE